MKHAVFALDKEICHFEECIKEYNNYIQELSTNIEHLRQRKEQKAFSPQFLEFIGDTTWELMSPKAIEEKINYYLTQIENYKNAQKKFEDNILELEQAKFVLRKYEHDITISSQKSS